MSVIETALRNYDAIAEIYPALYENAGQDEYDATLNALPALISPAGVAWVERQIIEFRATHHRDPENREIIALVSKNTR